MTREDAYQYLVGVGVTVILGRTGYDEPAVVIRSGCEGITAEEWAKLSQAADIVELTG